MPDPAVYQHVVRTKVVPPALPGALIVRPRVLARLSAEHRCTLVSAMPGYGKTAVVRQWIDTLAEPVAWVSLDILDLDPSTFWSHVLHAIGIARPGVDVEPALVLRERGPADGLFLAVLVAQLAELPEPFVLVLDSLPDQLDRSVLDGLAVLVDRAGETLRLVTTTRTDPILPLARWRASGWVAELREADLRLTDDEAVGIAAVVDTSFREPANVVALNHRVDGWPIALHMALLARPADAAATPPADDLLGGTDRLLASYLVGEVLAAMAPEERDVALALSVLEWFDPDLCRELVGHGGAAAVRQLLRRGVFLTVVDPRTGAMRFHDLFRELMELELGWHDPARRLELHRRAAIMWRDRGDLTAAYHHLSAIGEQQRAHDVLVRPAFDLVDRGDLTGLRRLARQLPPPAQVADASLAIDLANVACYADGTITARRWSDRAAELIAERAARDEATEPLTLRLHGLRCAIALLDADLDAALAGIEVHRRLRATATVTDTFEERFPILAGRVMLAARRMSEADEWISAAERIATPEILTAVTVPTLRAWYEWMFGRLDVATDIIGGAQRWMAEHGTGAHHLAFDTLITAGWCHLSAGNLREAGRLSTQAGADADTLGSPWNQLQAGYLAARVALVTGDPQRALRVVDELRTAIGFETCGSYADRLVGIEVEALAACGRIADARRLVPSLEPGPRAQVLAARFMGVSEREVDALLTDRSGWAVVERLQAELVLASRWHGTTPSGALVDLVAACGKSGWVSPFLGFGTRVEQLLGELPLAELHPALGRALAELAPTTPVHAADAVGMRLTSRELTLVELLPTHLSYAEIGERLYLSVNTVKSNLKALYRKLGATTRAEAVDACRHAGLL